MFFNLISGMLGMFRLIIWFFGNGCEVNFLMIFIVIVVVVLKWFFFLEYKDMVIVGSFKWWFLVVVVIVFEYKVLLFRLVLWLMFVIIRFGCLFINLLILRCI